MATIGSPPLNPLSRSKKLTHEERIVETATPPPTVPTSNDISTQPLRSPKSTVIESPAKDLDNSRLEELIKELGTFGYVAKAQPKYVKHTYDVREDIHHRFSSMYKILGRKTKEAVTEALEDWCKKYQNQYEIVDTAKR